MFHAVDYAAKLGFAPPSDFRESIFGPRPSQLLPTHLHAPARPYYYQASRDENRQPILAQLDRVVGPGRYSAEYEVADGELVYLPAVEQFEDDDLADGFRAPEEALREFARPLVHSAPTGNPNGHDAAMALGQLFWNLAMLPESLRPEALERAKARFGSEIMDSLRVVASAMVERHEKMFPHLHERR